MVAPDTLAVIIIGLGGVFAFLLRQNMSLTTRVAVLETRQADALPAIKQLCGEIRALHGEIAALRVLISEGKYRTKTKEGA